VTAIVANRQCVCVVSTVPEVLSAFMAPHIRALSENHPLMLVTSGSAEQLRGLLGPRVTFFSVNIVRNVSIVDDIRALVALWRLFRTQRCAVVHSITPKAGLLVMFAARAAGVLTRIHWFVGQVWVTRRGVVRWFIKSLDKAMVRVCTHLLADSPSQRTFLETEGVTRPGAIRSGPASSDSFSLDLMKTVLRFRKPRLPDGLMRSKPDPAFDRPVPSEAWYGCRKRGSGSGFLSLLMCIHRLVS